MSIDKKVSQAVTLIRSYSKGCVAYSGGKDSDVLAWLCKEAKVNFPLVHNVTTIDPPGTLSHCISAGATLDRPKIPFLQMIKKKGWPNMWRRWCCQIYKEYYISNTLFTGVRRSESVKRALRYKEPTICRRYPGKLTSEVVMPMLEFTNEDIELLVNQVPIRCHQLYYDDNGVFDVSRRLGCIGCPLQGDRGVHDFIQYPKFFKQWVKSFIAYNISRGRTENDAYDKIVKLLFYSNNGSYKYECSYHGLFEKPNSRILLSEKFNIDL